MEIRINCPEYVISTYYLQMSARVAQWHYAWLRSRRHRVRTPLNPNNFQNWVHLQTYQLTRVQIPHPPNQFPSSNPTPKRPTEAVNGGAQHLKQWMEVVRTNAPLETKHSKKKKKKKKKLIISVDRWGVGSGGLPFFSFKSNPIKCFDPLAIFDSQ